MFDFLELFPGPKCHLISRGFGRAVSVYVSDDDLDSLVLKFERKIEDDDVENGKLVPIAVEEIRKRGGKRSTTLRLSYESAEALHKALSHALKDVRKRRYLETLFENLMFVIMQYSEKSK